MPPYSDKDGRPGPFLTGMRILFHKTSDERHGLEIVRQDGPSERADDLESKSLLIHDFLHLAVESEAGLTTGFWGNLADGKTLAEMNDSAMSSRAQPRDPSAELMLIEQIVGAMSSAVKGRTAAEMMEGFRNFSLSQGKPLPDWLTEDFIARVQERMRKLIGHWKATPYGGTMQVAWS